MALSKDTLYKQPGETRLLSMDFSNKMTTGEVISSVDSISATHYGEVNTDLTFGNLTANAQQADFTVAGGIVPVREDINYCDYKVTVSVTTDLGQVLENDGMLRVQDD